MTICNNCELDKPDTEFNFKNKSTGKRHGNCKSCQKIYHDNWYANNRGRVILDVKNRRFAIRKETDKKIYKYLLSHPCVDCGESDPIVLEFDHIDPSQKEYDITVLRNNGYLWESIEQEILKCEVRCANCHRRKTAEQLGWRIFNM